MALRKVSPPSSHHPPTAWSRPGALEGVDLVWPPWWGKRGWPMSKAPGKWRSNWLLLLGPLVATGGFQLSISRAASATTFRQEV